MIKRNYWPAGLLLVLFGLTAFLWASGASEKRVEPVNRWDAFVLQEDGALSWFTLKKESKKINGTYHQRFINDDTNQPAFIDEQKYKVTGKETDNGYELSLEGKERKTLEAWISGKDLSVKRAGQPVALYKSASESELEKHQAVLEEELEAFLYDYEYKEQQRIKAFFDLLRSKYGYIHIEEDRSLMIFIQFHEALYEGELSGSMLVLNKSGSALQEEEYEINGITNGKSLTLFAPVDGKSVKLEGEFSDNLKNIRLSFWLTREKLEFHEADREELKRLLEEERADK